MEKLKGYLKEELRVLVNSKKTILRNIKANDLENEQYSKELDGIELEITELKSAAGKLKYEVEDEPES